MSEDNRIKGNVHNTLFIRERENKKVPISPQQLADDNPHLYEAIRQAIKTSSDYYWYISTQICNICDKSLTEKDKKLHSFTSFHHLCEKHLEYRNKFDIHGIRESLGFNYDHSEGHVKEKK